jgi:hypothetical protein
VACDLAVAAGDQDLHVTTQRTGGHGAGERQRAKNRKEVV